MVEKTVKEFVNKPIIHSSIFDENQSLFISGKMKNPNIDEIK